LLALGISMSLRDVIFRDAAANPGPCDAELGPAVVKVRADPPSDAEGRLAGDGASPPPLRRMHRRAGTLHDPADRLAAPDNLIVVGVAWKVSSASRWWRPASIISTRRA